jgi:ArsR family transcriptional regulator
MNTAAATRALQALASPQRLKMFRILVRRGPSGLAAGALATKAKASAQAASFHLKELERAGLVRSTRDGRFVRYAVHIEGTRQLIEYLTEECCDGHPELCGSAFARAKTPCTPRGIKA